MSENFIGFASLPEQIHRKSVKRGFEFTLMVVGESGLGKSTLIDSLFLTNLYKDREFTPVEERCQKTTRIEKKTLDIEEKGVRLRLNIVDTPGFGDGTSAEDSWQVVVDYIDEQYRQYFMDESGLNRKNIQDNRVHCCLYAVPSWGHSLRQMDLDMMRRLHKKVNIVIVITKADTLTQAEVKKLKANIMRDIEANGIQVYKFPECDSDEEEEFKLQDNEMKQSIPFAVVGSTQVFDIGGKKIRGRQYPWGFVDVENPIHSDFTKLRNMLISTHFHDLYDTTQEVHYENFRAQCIAQMTENVKSGKVRSDSIKTPTGESVIVPMVTETDKLLLQKEEEIRRMQEMLAEMQEKLKQQTVDV